MATFDEGGLELEVAEEDAVRADIEALTIVLGNGTQRGVEGWTEREATDNAIPSAVVGFLPLTIGQMATKDTEGQVEMLGGCHVEIAEIETLGVTITLTNHIIATNHHCGPVAPLV